MKKIFCLPESIMRKSMEKYLFQKTKRGGCRGRYLLGGMEMAYKEFISELQKKFKEKKQELGYNEMVFLEDGATSADAKEQGGISGG